jgi:hypothetical protein
MKTGPLGMIKLLTAKWLIRKQIFDEDCFRLLQECVASSIFFTKRLEHGSERLQETCPDSDGLLRTSVLCR